MRGWQQADDTALISSHLRNERKKQFLMCCGVQNGVHIANVAGRMKPLAPICAEGKLMTIHHVVGMIKGAANLCRKLRKWYPKAEARMTAI